MKSTLTDNASYCFFCGCPSECDHHLIFGTSGREFAEKYGLKVPICAKCHTISVHKSDRIHDNPMAEKLSKMLGQMTWERDRALEGMDKEQIRDRFIKERGVSYL